jgi:hypothetical protein
VLVTGGVLAVGALVLLGGRHLKTSLAVGLAVLFIAPAAWAGQTLGHATNGTFPAGGPSSAAAGGFGGPGGFAGRRQGGPRAGLGRPPGAGTGTPPTGAPAAPTGAGGGGGLGGGDSQSITEALAYIKTHGGGTLAVSSQNGGAATSIIDSGADVVAIGGFSGRESQVTARWLADRVQSGAIRWVLTTGDGGPGNDGRVGSSDVMAAVAANGRPVSSVSGLYDVAGTAQALRS